MLLSGLLALVTSFLIATVLVMSFSYFQLQECGCINFDLVGKSPIPCSCVHAFITSFKFSLLLALFRVNILAFLAIVALTYLFWRKLIKFLLRRQCDGGVPRTRLAP